MTTPTLLNNHLTFQEAKCQLRLFLTLLFTTYTQSLFMKNILFCCFERINMRCYKAQQFLSLSMQPQKEEGEILLKVLIFINVTSISLCNTVVQQLLLTSIMCYNEINCIAYYSSSKLHVLHYISPIPLANLHHVSN